MRKHILYWLGYLLLLGGGIAAVWTRLIPTQNTMTFLLALFFLWNGCLLLLNQNPIFHVEPKRHMVIYGVSILALGLVWIPVSMHPQANQGWLQAVTGIPVLLVLFAAHRLYPGWLFSYWHEEKVSYLYRRNSSFI